MNCSEIKMRNNVLLQELAIDLQIEADIEDLLQQYTSIFTSFEEDRERLRVIAVRKDKTEEKKSVVRETLVLIGKRVLKKMPIDMETAKLKAEIFCKLWQQVKNINNIKEQEKFIQKNLNKLKDKTGISYL